MNKITLCPEHSSNYIKMFVNLLLLFASLYNHLNFWPFQLSYNIISVSIKVLGVNRIQYFFHNQDYYIAWGICDFKFS